MEEITPDDLKNEMDEQLFSPNAFVNNFLFEYVDEERFEEAKEAIYCLLKTQRDFPDFLDAIKLAKQ
ncbi:hypothetical protein FGF1_03730 [Flavobacteriaceae bacterium GF1]